MTTYSVFYQCTRKISSLELPLIEHKEGPDMKKLPVAIQGMLFHFPPSFVLAVDHTRICVLMAIFWNDEQITNLIGL